MLLMGSSVNMTQAEFNELEERSTKTFQTEMQGEKSMKKINPEISLEMCGKISKGIICM